MISDIIKESVAAIESLLTIESEIETAIGMISTSILAGGKILTCGNGGSAADAEHFTTEFLCRLKEDRPPIAAVSLTTDGSFLSATANDYGYDEVFARQVRGLGKPGDILIGISTSGNSPNVIEALKAGRESGLKTISMLGHDGGKAKGLADVDLLVPHPDTARIQEAQQVLIHLLCGGVEQRVFPDLEL